MIRGIDTVDRSPIDWKLLERSSTVRAVAPLILNDRFIVSYLIQRSISLYLGEKMAGPRG